LTAAIQNMIVLIRYSKGQDRALQERLPKPNRLALYGKCKRIKSLLKLPVLSFTITR
jgi:hypothetical protein